MDLARMRRRTFVAVSPVPLLVENTSAFAGVMALPRKGAAEVNVSRRLLVARSRSARRLHRAREAAAFGRKAEATPVPAQFQQRVRGVMSETVGERRVVAVGLAAWLELIHTARG